MNTEKLFIVKWYIVLFFIDAFLGGVVFLLQNCIYCIINYKFVKMFHAHLQRQISQLRTKKKKKNLLIEVLHYGPGYKTAHPPHSTEQCCVSTTVQWGRSGSQGIPPQVALRSFCQKLLHQQHLQSPLCLLYVNIIHNILII